MHLGFSYVGAAFLIMLFVPNMLWAKNKPEGYEKYVANESRLLLAFERVGEAAVTVLCLIFSDFNIMGFGGWSAWLIAAAVLMILYEVFWIRYFKSKKTMKDFYGSLLGIPVPGASLPVAAFLLLAVYGKNPILAAADILLAVGHIGIHLGHRKEICEKSKNHPA